MWGSSYLLFWFWRHRVFGLEPTCQQNKCQIPDIHSGTNRIHMAAEPCSARICGKSTSEMLCQVRFFTGCCFAELLQVQSWALPQFHNSGRNCLHPAFIFSIHLSYIFLESKEEAEWDSCHPLCPFWERMLNAKLFGFNIQRSERRNLTYPLKWKFKFTVMQDRILREKYKDF